MKNTISKIKYKNYVYLRIIYITLRLRFLWKQEEIYETIISKKKYQNKLTKVLSP
jgi:hypothetical protein